MKHTGLSLKIFNCRVETISRQGFDHLGPIFLSSLKRLARDHAQTCTRMGYIIYMSISAIVIRI